jgi:hypothetical protein
MKTILTITILFTSIQLYAQDRVDESMPVITKKIATLKQATGWRKNDIGKWVSAKNAIPTESHDFNFADESFTDYTIYKVSIDSKVYSMLVKTEKNEFTYYMFDTAQNKALADSSYFVSKDLICYGEHFLMGRFDESKLLTEIKSDFRDFDNSVYSKYVLNVSMKWFPSKNIFRFYFDGDSNIIPVDLEKETLLDKYFETADLVFKKFIQEL